VIFFPWKHDRLLHKTPQDASWFPIRHGCLKCHQYRQHHQHQSLESIFEAECSIEVKCLAATEVLRWFHLLFVIHTLHVIRLSPRHIFILLLNRFALPILFVCFSYCSLSFHTRYEQISNVHSFSLSSCWITSHVLAGLAQEKICRIHPFFS
jgi:hypothetical protein